MDLNEKKGYDVTSDIIYDNIHAFLEDVCNIAMSGTKAELCKYSHINLNLINNRVECFDFRIHSNRPIPICQRNVDWGSSSPKCGQLLLSTTKGSHS